MNHREKMLSLTPAFRKIMDELCEYRGYPACEITYDIYPHVTTVGTYHLYITTSVVRYVCSVNPFGRTKHGYAKQAFRMTCLRVIKETQKFKIMGYIEYSRIPLTIL